MASVAVEGATAPASLPTSGKVSLGRRSWLHELTLLTFLLVLGLQLRRANLEHYSGSFDEGVRMEQLLLMEHGYRPYRDIFASQGPLLLDLLYPFYIVFGGTLGAARLGVIALGLIGLIGAWWTARAFGPLAGLGAAALLTISPAYVENSRLALAEVPSLAPCLWAVGCALRWQRGGSAGWLYGALALATFGVLVKPMAVAVAVPIALLAVLRPNRRPLVLMGACLLSLTLVALVLFTLGPTRVIEVLASYRSGAQGLAGSAAGQNLALLARLVGGGERAGFLALVAVGTGFGLLCWRPVGLALVAWPLAQLALFSAYTDLADKHIVYLIPPMALLGGLALAGLGLAVRRFRVTRSPTWAAAGLAVLMALVLYAASVPLLWHYDRELRNDADERARRDYLGTQEQADLMRTLTDPTDFVLTDNPIAAFQAGRLVPPWLVDTSGTRVDAGSLTAGVAIREAVRYQPKVVVTWRRRLGKLEDFNRWLASDYRLIKTYPGSDPAMPLQLYVRAELEESARAFLAGR
jgi:hypothetical protein